jgi:hypothetical protein
MKMLYQVLEKLQCTKKDVASTWIDDTNIVQADIAYLIAQYFNDEKTEKEYFEDAEYKGSKYASFAIVECDCQVVMLIGMPDSMYYKKKDEQKLLEFYKKYC